MDLSTLALIISLIALGLSLGRYLFDLFRLWRPKSSKAKIHLGLLAGRTNCFITRSGYLLVLVSLRVYKDSDHLLETQPVTIDNSSFKAKIGRRWHTAELYQVPQANIFPSLLRNSLPTTIAPGERQDFYEVFALDQIIPGTEIKIQLSCQTHMGKTIRHRFRLKHQTDKRPVFDLLFGIL